MALFDLKILTPERLVFEGKAQKIVTRTTEGDIGIYARHIDYVAALSIGKLVVTFEEEVKTAALADGFISVTNGEVVILTDYLEWADEIDVNRAEKAKEKAENNLKTASSNSQQDLEELKLKKAINRLNVSR